MIIKISYPSSLTQRILKRKTKEFQHRISQRDGNSTRDCSDVNRAKILLNKKSMLVNFNSSDSNAISTLREYLSFVFENAVIGVDQQNPLTINLEKVNVLLFAEGGIW